MNSGSGVSQVKYWYVQSGSDMVEILYQPEKSRYQICITSGSIQQRLIIDVLEAIMLKQLLNMTDILAAEEPKDKKI